MPFAVLLTDDAAQDLSEIYEHIARNDAPLKADHVLAQIEKAFASLTETPNHGVWPKELLAVGIREYREIFFKPYRIVYRVVAEQVYILLIADGRRDMQTLLQKRLLGA